MCIKSIPTCLYGINPIAQPPVNVTKDSKSVHSNLTLSILTQLGFLLYTAPGSPLTKYNTSICSHTIQYKHHNMSHPINSQHDLLTWFFIFFLVLCRCDLCCHEVRLFTPGNNLSPLTSTGMADTGGLPIKDLALLSASLHTSYQVTMRLAYVHNEISHGDPCIVRPVHSET